MRRFRSMSPHDNAILGSVEISSVEDVHATIAAARKASGGWRALGVRGRVEILKRFTANLSRRADEFAQIVSKEMGMPLTASYTEVEDAVLFMESYCTTAEKYLAPAVVFESGAEVHTVFREPYGVAAVISPWNYPVSNFVWGCGQTLLAGNTVVFKHSEEVPLSGKLLDKIVVESGLPDGVFAQVYGKGPVGALLARGDVDLICFTGSTETGLSLYRVAAQGMKKIVMELGGSAPGIVFEDADLDLAIPSIYASRFSNAGQSCDALKRLLVHESVWDVTVERLAARLRMVVLGNPLSEGTTMGPLVAKRQVDLLERQVADALEKGATVAYGGKRPALLGAYFEPTLLAGVTRDMRVWQEETFGPVLPMVKFTTEAEAIALANDTRFGLGAYVYTKDKGKATRTAAGLHSGMVSINGVNYVRPENPFGGYKSSGLGREHGRFGFEEVTQVKVVADTRG